MGKYHTVLWLSLAYCAGHACLALFDDHRTGFYFRLFLIALGSGGIKPLVASFVGDQFDQTNKHLAKIVFDAFYWIINFGSFFASLLVPIFLRHYGPSVAFGIPGVLMFIATVIFCAGRKKYVRVPPSPPDPHSFLNVVRTALATPAPGQGRPGLVVAGIGAALAAVSLAMMGRLGFVSAFCLALVFVLAFGGAGAWMQLERARGPHPDESVDGVRAALRILIIFALVTPFWSLFDQKASTWILQADQMVKPHWFQSAQMQTLNPALVMILIPFNNLVLHPALKRFGFEPTALRRMGAGIAFSGLEFAYSQAPAVMKGVIMAFWNLSVTIGNLCVLLVNASVRNDSVISHIAGTGLSETAFLMFFCAGFALVVAAMFAWYARRYPMQDHYRPA